MLNDPMFWASIFEAEKQFIQSEPKPKSKHQLPLRRVGKARKPAPRKR
jgi:hypothetical protein